MHIKLTLYLIITFTITMGIILYPFIQYSIEAKAYDTTVSEKINYLIDTYEFEKEKASQLNDELNIVVDPETGCQYIVHKDDSENSNKGKMVPRYDSQGKLYCK